MEPEAGRAYHFVGGHKRAEQEFRECLVREIAEELHLREGPDDRVSTAAPAHLEFAEVSESRRVEARCIMERFDVEPHPRADPGVAANPENHWLTAAEVRSG